MPKFQDLSGKQFTDLKVLFRLEGISPVTWVCACSCGITISVRAGNLKSKNTTNCGCKRGLRARTHTHTVGGQSPTYKSWVDMKTRCLNKNSVAFPHYGGRGITIQTEWVHSFPRFLSDMGERGIGYTLERVRVEGNYTKENCIWVLKKYQGGNKRNSRLLTYKGRTRCLAEWGSIYGEYIKGRIKKGFTIQEAIEIPKGQKRRDFYKMK